MKRKILIIITLFMLVLTPFLFNNNNEKVKAEIIQQETTTQFKIKRANFTYLTISGNDFNTYNIQNDIEIGQMFTNEIATGTYNNNQYILMSLSYVVRPPNNNYSEYWCNAFVTDAEGNMEMWDTDERVTIDNNTLTNYNYTRQQNEFIFNIIWTPTQEMQTLTQNLTQNEIMYISQWLEPQTTQLETPTIERISKNQIQWEEIQNAIAYEINITHNNETTTSNNYQINDGIVTGTITNIESGTYNIKVKAKPLDYTTMSDSEYSNTITMVFVALTAPQITINLNTLHWNSITNATSYEIYKDNVLIATTQNTQWVTIENGNYNIKAIASNEEWNYANSTLSNTIQQNNYNDMIGNGVNWFTLMSAVVDSQIYLMKSLLNYTIWDINFFQLFTFIITIILTVFIIKFIKGW